MENNNDMPDFVISADSLIVKPNVITAEMAKNIANEKRKVIDYMLQQKAIPLIEEIGNLILESAKKGETDVVYIVPKDIIDLERTLGKAGKTEVFLINTLRKKYGYTVYNHQDYNGNKIHISWNRLNRKK